MVFSKSKGDDVCSDQFRWLAENSMDIIHVFDTRGNVIYINPAVKDSLGYEQKEMVGKNAFRFVHPGDLLKVTESFAKAKVKGAVGGKMLEIRIRHKQGFWKTFEVVSRIVFTDSGKMNLIVNSRDITERKMVEQMKEEFLSFVAHELKTPVTVMKLASQNVFLKLKKQNASDGLLKRIRDIDNETDRLTGLINDILDVTRLESGKIRFNVTFFDLTELLTETVEGLRSLARQKIKLSKKRKVMVRGDRGRIKQVLINLLSNSIKYSKQNGEIIINSSKGKRFVTVSIKDEGSGIPKEKLSNLFKRFYQIEKGSARGLGLGLYISKEIIDRHDCKIWVESRKGKGSIFYFTLPLV
ncbi:MAG TPA: PAS domain-containing sensor histidine kinase [Patescibacteria group bacterium]